MAWKKARKQPGRSRRWSQHKVNTGPNPMAGYMNDKKKFIPISLGSRSDAARGGEGYTPNHEYLLRKYPAPPPLEQASPEQIVAKAKNGYPRAVVLTQLAQGRFRGQREQRIHELLLQDGKYIKMRLYVGGSYLFFVREKLVTHANERVLSHSITYRNLERAMFAYKMEKIVWTGHVTQPIAPPKADQ